MLNRTLLRRLVRSLLPLVCFTPAHALADGTRDNLPDAVRPIPPIGKELAPADADVIKTGLEALGARIDALREQLKDKPPLLAQLPDVRIYYNAVRYPLVYHETIDPADARQALADGMERARLLASGQTPWTSTSGPRGYLSRIDGSVQPYRLTIPSEYVPAKADGRRFRLDFWGHGRDELLTELRFVIRPDPLPDLSALEPYHQPKDKFILSLYGRYINAFKFAGEIDGLEALDAVCHSYPIDENRILDIGFSMGGAGAWEYAVHYTDLFAAATPGAGFSETPEFLKTFQKEDVSNSPWYEQTLYHLYDCTDIVANLSNLPTIAYAGEIDPQKQASDAMLRAAALEHVDLQRIVGPKTAHRYEPAAKRELDRRIDEILSKGRNPVPPRLRFTTYTLRYNRMYWITVDGLEHHWRRARADGSITHDAQRAANGIALQTENVTALTLSFPAGRCPFEPGRRPIVQVDQTKLTAPPVADDRSWTAHFVRSGDAWKTIDVPLDGSGGLRKIHGLQGPIDDGFMDRFLIVRPTGKAFNAKCGEWEQAECDHAIEHWRKQFRAEAPVKDDTQVTGADIANSNLVCFGDPSSNRLIARIIGKLPIAWDASSIRLGARTIPAATHVPILIYPNPLHPVHYLVLNSGFTYREYDYLNNARQTPKLPDYSVIDVDVPPTSRSPGGVTATGFFGEDWSLLPDDGVGAVGWHSER